MDELLTFEEVKKQGIAGIYEAVMKDGTKRTASYITEHGGALFIDRNRDSVVGYRLIRKFGE